VHTDGPGHAQELISAAMRWITRFLWAWLKHPPICHKQHDAGNISLAGVV
jgi:hypothetical protein